MIPESYPILCRAWIILFSVSLILAILSRSLTGLAIVLLWPLMLGFIPFGDGWTAPTWQQCYEWEHRGVSRCNRCGLFYTLVWPHYTPYKLNAGANWYREPTLGDRWCYALVLCDPCWRKLTPKERLAFYERVVPIESRFSSPSEVERWNVLSVYVLAGEPNNPSNRAQF